LGSDFRIGFRIAFHSPVSGGVSRSLFEKRKRERFCGVCLGLAVVSVGTASD
jgi:hypothetical protein